VFFLLLGAPLNASAFLFGGLSDKKAEEILYTMSVNFENGDCRAVADLSDTLFSEKPSSVIREKAYSYLGRCYEARELPDKAITVYKLAHGLYPESDFFSARLAAIYFKTGFYATAVPLFEKALKSSPDNMEANTGLARCYAALGFLSKAKLYYARAVILGEFGDLVLLKEYAAQMLRSRDWDEAAMIAEYARKLAPEDAGLYETLARVAAGRGDYKRAAAHMRAAVKLEPSNRSWLLEAALADFLGGDNETALAAAVPQGDHDALALLIRGMALHRKGEKTAASGYFRKAAASGPSFIADFAAALLNR
jgi:tetratricopeptide (TPR) repeat protein